MSDKLEEVTKKYWDLFNKAAHGNYVEIDRKDLYRSVYVIAKRLRMLDQDVGSGSAAAQERQGGESVGIKYELADIIAIVERLEALERGIDDRIRKALEDQVRANRAKLAVDVEEKYPRTRLYDPPKIRPLDDTTGK